MTCPTPETLVPHALGADDPVIAGHVVECPACEAEVARLRETAGILRGPVVLERRLETAECLEEQAIADFVEGRLGAEARAPVVAHLLTCARCRAVAQATSRLLADPAVAREIPRAGPPAAERRWRHWSLPLGVAAAAAVLLLVWPSTNDTGSTPGLREPTDTSIVAPVPIAPRGSVATVDRFVWSGVTRADRYRLRLYDEEGAVRWTVETSDTVAALPDSLVLTPGIPYFWKVEAQTEWRRWAASDLVEFKLTGSQR